MIFIKIGPIYWKDDILKVEVIMGEKNPNRISHFQRHRRPGNWLRMSEVARDIWKNDDIMAIKFAPQF